MIERVTLLGATGSIGRSALDVISRHPDRYAVHALTAHTNIELLAELCSRFSPAIAVISDECRENDLRGALGERGVVNTAVRAGMDALSEVSEEPTVDTVIAGIVGAAGLPSTLAAAEAGKRLLLANKEALVMAGPLVMQAVARSGAVLLPLDSEHNALFQCLPAKHVPGRLAEQGVRRLLLTASGGPFRSRTPGSFATITPAEACAHPNWSMGRKISVDSATMMNKGLEVIEAGWLFGVEPAAVGVVIHPQSVVHSLVEYTDGSVLAQLGNPDMRTPIAHALAWPDRIDAGVRALDLIGVARLEFEPPDPARFPCLELAIRASGAGPCGPAVLNAANEVAVAAFLDGRLPFTGIPSVIERVLAGSVRGNADSLNGILACDRSARRQAETLVSAYGEE